LLERTRRFRLCLHLYVTDGAPLSVTLEIALCKSQVINAGFAAATSPWQARGSFVPCAEHSHTWPAHHRKTATFVACTLCFTKPQNRIPWGMQFFLALCGRLGAAVRCWRRVLYWYWPSRSSSLSMVARISVGAERFSNLAASVDAPGPSLFAFPCQWRRATDARR
jgi:hypothetical protein